MRDDVEHIFALFLLCCLSAEDWKGFQRILQTHHLRNQKTPLPGVSGAT